MKYLFSNVVLAMVKDKNNNFMKICNNKMKGAPLLLAFDITMCSRGWEKG